MWIAARSLGLSVRGWCQSPIRGRKGGNLEVLAWLERLVVTPSVHRVHHGRNEAYLDRNYGELLTLWDHLLGTYEAEHEEPDYGVLKPVEPGDLREVQLSPWRDLWTDLRRAPGWGSRLRYLFDAPGYRHDGADERVRARRAREKRAG